MKKHTFLAILSVVCTALFVAPAAPAAFVLTLSQVGGNVVVNGSGTLNLSALTYFGQMYSNGGLAASLSPSSAGLISGPGQGAVYQVNMYDGGGLTGPTSFGTGNSSFADSGTGLFAGIGNRAGFVYVQPSYVSGTALTNSSTYVGQTFDSLGFTPGTYTYTWGTGANADSLTITSVVPEPSTWALLGVGAGLLSLALLRRRAEDV